MGRGWLAHARLRRHARALTIAWAGYWVVLTGLLLSPKLPRPPIPLDRRSIIAHVAAFVALGAGCTLVRWAWRGRLGGRWLATWVGVFAVYGMATELIQPYVRRKCDVADWVGDMGGIVLGFALTWLAIRRRGGSLKAAAGSGPVS